MRRALVLTACLLCASCTKIDRGRCLRSHTDHYHTDAYTSYEPNIGIDYRGKIETQWHFVHHDARDWDVWTCDQWEWPQGKPEQDK